MRDSPNQPFSSTLRLVLLGAVVCSGASAAHGQTRQPVGALSSIEKSVLLDSTRSSDDAAYRQARLKQAVYADQHLRTLKRSRAAVRFVDAAELRVNERTELVVQSSAALRKVRLSAGAVWLKVPKGQATVVETPTVTAAVRGTEFEITSDGALRVYGGEVAFGPPGKAVNVGAFQMASYAGGAMVGPEEIPVSERPASHGGPSEHWWETLIDGREELGSSTSPFFAEAGTSPSSPRYLAEDDGKFVSYDFELDAASETVAGTESLWWGLGAAALFGGAGAIGMGAGGGFDAFTGTDRVALGMANFRLSSGSNHFEGSFWNRPGLNGVSASSTPGATFAVSRTINEMQVKAGRFGLHLSPVALDPFDQAVGSDRYSGVAVELKKGAWNLTGAWTDDAEARMPGSQPAWIGSADLFIAGARVGATLMHPAGRDATRSFAAHFAVPVVPGCFEVYGAFGTTDAPSSTGPGQGLVDSGRRETVGAYLPALFERWDVDCFVEYQRHGAFGTGWSSQLAYRPSKNWALVGGGSWVGNLTHWRIGVQARF